MRGFLLSVTYFLIICAGHLQMSFIWSFNLTLKRTTAQLSCRNVGHFRDYTHPDYHIPSTDNMIPGFKPLSEITLLIWVMCWSFCLLVSMTKQVVYQRCFSPPFARESHYRSLSCGEYITAKVDIAFSLHLMNKMPRNLIRRYKAQFRRRYTHVPNLTDELSTA